jgi:hypothetical protein
MRSINLNPENSGHNEKPLMTLMLKTKSETETDSDGHRN